MIRRLSTAIALLMLCLVASPLPVSAYEVFNGVDCSNSANSKSAVCNSKTNQDPISGDDGILAKATNIVAFAGGAAAIIVIIVSALRLVTSGSDVSTGSRTDTDVENARRGIASALIGLAVIVLGRSLILFLLGHL